MALLAFIDCRLLFSVMPTDKPMTSAAAAADATKILMDFFSTMIDEFVYYDDRR